MVMGELVQETDVLVIGGGPGGYAAAFKAADLGMDVTMVELSDRPGGVCLFRGCIPSKTYLYLSEFITHAERIRPMGISFGKPSIDLDAVRNWKNKVVDKLSSGLVSLANKRGILYIKGRAVFEDPHTVILYDSDIRKIKFKQAVIATGSRAISFPGVERKKGGRIMTSSDALDLADIPQRLLVVGGGYVGLELGSVYAALGSRVTLVELGDRLLPGVDADLVRVLDKRIRGMFESVSLKTRVESMKPLEDHVTVEISGSEIKGSHSFDRVLVAIGRKPNTSGLGLDAAGVEIDAQGFIKVDHQQRTSQNHIFSVGDVVGGVMLAHKATKEGKVAAEVMAGKASAFDVRAMPAVVFTDPQIAWCGLTEEEALRKKVDVQVKRFPWKISGRAITMGLEDGLTKMIVDKKTQRILGVGIVGKDTEGLISEGVLAIEMGALAEDLAESIHPHPTLAETQMEVAEVFLGPATHLM